MADKPNVSPFSRPPAPPKVFARPAVSASRPTMVSRPAGAVEAAENLPLGFMAGLVAAAIGAGQPDAGLVQADARALLLRRDPRGVSVLDRSRPLSRFPDVADKCFARWRLIRDLTALATR